MRSAEDFFHIVFLILGTAGHPPYKEGSADTCLCTFKGDVLCHFCKTVVRSFLVIHFVLLLRKSSGAFTSLQPLLTIDVGCRTVRAGMRRGGRRVWKGFSLSPASY